MPLSAQFMYWNKSFFLLPIGDAYYGSDSEDSSSWTTVSSSSGSMVEDDFWHPKPLFLLSEIRPQNYIQKFEIQELTRGFNYIVHFSL